MTARETFFFAELFLYEAETPEVIAAVFAAYGFCAKREHGACQQSGAIILTAPTAQIHTMAAGALGENQMGYGVNICAEAMAAIVTTEMVDAEKVNDLTQDKFLAG